MKKHVNATVKKRLKITRHGTRLYGVSNLLGASVRHQIRIIFSSKLDTSITELINSESHLQVSVVIRLVEVYILEFRNISLYVGGENLTNYKIANPIQGAHHPWDAGFDATQVWGPVTGAMAYVGLRFKLEKL